MNPARKYQAGFDVRFNKVDLKLFLFQLKVKYYVRFSAYETA